MSHQDEYHDAMVRMLELIWGEGYMAPGGADNVARMLEGLETHGKRVLDIGSGIGGPAREIKHPHAGVRCNHDVIGDTEEQAVLDDAGHVVDIPRHGLGIAQGIPEVAIDDVVTLIADVRS